MRIIHYYWVTVYLILFHCLPVYAEKQTNTPLRIRISQSMLINENACGDASLLFDEPGLDPLKDGGVRPKTKWNAGYYPWSYPAGVVVDLQANYHINGVYLYDSEGQGNVRFEYGKPFHWQPLFIDAQSQYLQWSIHDCAVDTRYLHIEIENGAVPDEIVIYGYRIGETKQSKPVKTLKIESIHTDMSRFIGVNGFIDDPIGNLEAFSFVREYHVLPWNCENDKISMKFNPSYPGWDFDKYYQSLSKAGVMVSPCIEQAFDGSDNKPVANNADSTDPKSYSAHSAYLYQYAARYGKAEIGSGNLKLAPGQPALSGLDVIKYYENWNEPDKWWQGKNGHFTPYELAAMCSSDYDGHLKALPEGCGLKNADPSAKLVLGGLTDAVSFDYLDAMRFWIEHNRNGKALFDVINFHHYSTDAGGQGGVSKSGISPEEDHLKEKISKLVRYCRQYFPGAEVWVSEFGYDTNQASPFHAPSIGKYTPEMVQGQWIMRAYLLLAATGVDKAQVYMIRDVDAKSSTQFSSSGLTSSKETGEIPKTSWYYIACMNKLLRNTHFDCEMPSGNKEVTIYRFAGVKGHYIYVLWRPASDGRIVDRYRLPLPKSVKTVELTVPADRQIGGITKKIDIRQSGLELTVTELPIFLTVVE